MTNNSLPPEYENYRGMRGLLLTRKSSQSQSHEAQEREIREVLVRPLDILLDEDRHVKHSTYTGLDFSYYELLEEILMMAKRKEFKLLLVGDRDRGLGRKAIEREVYIARLHEYGVHILSTNPNDNLDDESSMGVAMRVMKGLLKDQPEIEDFVRRSKRGKRNKAVNNKVVGNGGRKYGLKYVRDEKGKVETYEINYDFVLEDKKNVEWSETRVMRFIFRCIHRGITLVRIAKRLNDIGIPSAVISTGRKYTSRGVKEEKPLWQASTISKMARNLIYSGRCIVGGYKNVKVQGLKRSRSVRTEKEDQIVVSVPATVSIQMQDECIAMLNRNKRFAMRNNQQEKPALMRGGLAKCGNCGRTVSPKPKGSKGRYVTYYVCISASGQYKCKGCTTRDEIVDSAVWNVCLEIIKDPKVVDEALKRKCEEDKTVENRRILKKDLAENQLSQQNLRLNLVEQAQGKLDSATVEAFNVRLKELKEIEYRINLVLQDSEAEHRKWEKTQQQLAKLHQKCRNMQVKMKDPSYQPSDKEKREMVEYFGITVIVWEDGHVNSKTGEIERVKVQARFADIDVTVSTNPF
jgi:site-specific DNA recombinase